eukprot:6009376-Pleurochrysis_carterae.AAC.1
MKGCVGGRGFMPALMAVDFGFEGGETRRVMLNLYTTKFCQEALFGEHIGARRVEVDLGEQHTLKWQERSRYVSAMLLQTAVCLVHPQRMRAKVRSLP